MTNLKINITLNVNIKITHIKCYALTPLSVMYKGFVTTKGLMTIVLNPMFSLFCLVGFSYTCFSFSKMGNILLHHIYLKNIK